MIVKLGFSLIKRDNFEMIEGGFDLPEHLIPEERVKVITCFNTLGIYNKNRFNFIRQMVWKYLDRS